MIALLIESAGRSLLLFLAVFAALRVLRIRNEHTQLFVWRAVLVAAWFMPFFLQARIVSIPAVELDPELLNVGGFVQAQSTTSFISIVSIVYALITLLLMGRFAIGLIASWRLQRNSTQIEGKAWSSLKVRASSSISAPATVGSTVLLPTEFTTWSSYKLRATLAHEAAHVRNRDFYWHAAALLYRALFWINPLAWWLPKRMTRLAESLCDGSAVRSVGDPLAYAELLISFATHPAQASLSVAPLTVDMVSVDMARSTDVESRVAQLLNGDIQGHEVRRSRWTLCGAVLIAVATVCACASCERQADMQATTTASDESTQRENIVEPRLDPNQALTLPAYIDSERKAGHEGVVFLAVLVDTDGRVAKSRIKKSSGFEPLDREAEAHARGYWRLIPATRNGVPVERWVTIPVKFKLSEHDASPDA